MQIYRYMRMPQIGTRVVLAAAVLVAGLSVSFAILAQAQEPTEAEIDAAGITFPIAELGGCRNKAECKQFCDQPGNMPACIEFAVKHGLMSKEEAEFAKKFKDRLDVGGPGGCRTPSECEAYCSNIDRLEECMSFAEDHGVDNRHVREGRKILAHIRAGGQTPGDCKSKSECEAYCSSADNFEECLAFAERVGLEPDIEGDLSREELRRVMDLMQRGESPGGCRSKAECEAYCENPNNFEECIAFAEKAGFVSPEEAELARRTGGAGPGGCRTPRECETYCNNPANQEACFAFAKEHGLLREEDLKRMKEGLIHLRTGLEQAPPEVAACLKASLGQNIIQEIEAGTLLPGPAIGDKMRACFDKFGQRGAPQEVFDRAPPEVVSCMKEKLGAEFEAIRSGEKLPGPEIGSRIRSCFEQFGPRPGGFFEDAPSEVVQCIKNRVGEEFERIKAGEIPPGPEFEQKARSCFEEFSGQHEFGPPPDSFQRVPPPGTPPSGDFPGPGSGGFDFENLPPSVFDCVKIAFGENVIERLRSGSLPAAEFAAKVKSCFLEADAEPPFGGSGAIPHNVPESSLTCPAMPTVKSCPAGYERVVVFESPECGAYYGCEPTDESQGLIYKVFKPLLEFLRLK